MADKKKKQQKQQEEEVVQEAAIDPLEAFLKEAKGNSDSLRVITDILNETVLQKAAEHLYNQYLAPKVRPYTALQTMELAVTQVSANFLEHDWNEAYKQKHMPEAHIWDDAEEPEPSMNDRFVTDNIKCEVKLPFNINYGADLNEMMGTTNHNGIDVMSQSSRSSKRKNTKAKSSIMRKMTMKVTMQQTQDTGSEKSFKSATSKKFGKMKSMTGGIDGSNRNDSKKAKAQERRKTEQHLNLKLDPDRPQEDGVVQQDVIEVSIEKKRAKVNIDAIHKAQKAKQQQNLFNVAGGLSRKGGIPNTKLRGITDADFFQKNNTTEKGFTFNYDGSLVDFRKPKMVRELDAEMDYEVAHEAIIGKGAKKKMFHSKNPSNTVGNSGGFANTRTSGDFNDAEKAEQKLKRSQTMQDGGNEYETGGSMHFMAHKQGVIEFNHVAPSKVMSIEAGVEMIEKGKSLKGEDFKIEGKFKLEDYRKLHDPRAQQVADTMKMNKKRASSNMDLNVEVSGEDPYKSFRRSLIANQRETGSARGTQHMQTALSKASLSKFGGETHEYSDEKDSMVGGKSFESINRKAISRSIINHNKVSMGDNSKEVDKFLADLNVEQNRQSIDSSYMMIEISDLDLKDGLSNPMSRAATALGGNGKNNNYSMNLKAPTPGGRYGSIRQNPSGIVASARRELNDLQKSTIPRSRMSVEGGLRQKYDTQGGSRDLTGANGNYGLGKLSIGLPLLKNDSMKLQSAKSLAQSSTSVNDRISLYRNDDERQTMMKQINDQQANYTRLLAKQRPGQDSNIPMKQSLKPKSNLEAKNLASFKKQKVPSMKQHRVSQLSTSK